MRELFVDVSVVFLCFGISNVLICLLLLNRFGGPDIHNVGDLVSRGRLIFAVEQTV